MAKIGLKFTVPGNEVAALLGAQAKDAFEFASILEQRSKNKFLKVKANAERLDFMAKHVDQQEMFELGEFELRALGIGVVDKNE